MWRVSILDPNHPIIELVWSGRVEPEEVGQANEKLAECFRVIGKKPFDMLVDTSGLITFPAETQRLIVEQQKWVLSMGLRRAAVVVPNSAVKMALDMTRAKSGHTEEYKFPSREEALAFLKSS